MDDADIICKDVEHCSINTTIVTYEDQSTLQVLKGSDRFRSTAPSPRLFGNFHFRSCFQVDFKKIVQVTDIATQGRNSPSWPQWVKSYEIQYSTNGGSWASYKHGSVVKVYKYFKNVFLLIWFAKYIEL